MPLPNTALGEKHQTGAFKLPDTEGILLELKELLTNLDCHPVQFMANHASNYLPLSGRLMRDRDTMVQTINDALLGAHPLVPEHFRGL